MIIVFGSNVLDLFFHVEDLPPRDQNVFIERHYEAPGGKGANQAVAAAKAGAHVYFSGALGKGGHGRQMYDNLVENDVDTSGIRFLKGVPSGLATVFVDERDGTHRIVVSQGANLHAKQEWIPDHLLNPSATLLVQGELPMAETEQLIERAKKLGARTIMNFAPATALLGDETLRKLDYIILNEHEARLLAAQKNMDADDLSSFAASLQKEYGVTTIITLGSRGAICASPEGLQNISSLEIKAVDTVGAGDAFAGYFAASLDQGAPLSDALRLASVAGALACTQEGAQLAVPALREVKARISEIAN